MKLANLTGSEKQIAWAEDIRRNYVTWYEMALDEIDADIADEDNEEEDIAELTTEKASMVAAFARVIETHSSASWWIEHRTTDPKVVAGACYKPSYLSAIRKLIRTADRRF